MPTLPPAHTRFAAALHGWLRATVPGGDLVWSPYSVAAALYLVAAGARGRTRGELRDALAPGTDLDDPARLLRAAAALAPEPDGAPGSDLAVTNTLWARTGLPIESDYVATVRDLSSGAVRTADFGTDPGLAAAQINDDVAKTTRGLIDSIVDRVAVTDAHAVLVNALWVYLRWSEPFTVAATRPLKFRSPDGKRTIPAMRAQRTMRYAQAAGWRMVSLAGRGGLAFDVLLPDRPLADTTVTADDLAELHAAARDVEVRLALPRFELSRGIELAAPIAALGAPTIFTDDADLSGISPRPLKIDRVVHKARLRVDEAGAEGAAATAVTTTLAAAVPRERPVELIVDRPFLVVLRHAASGALYFLAEVTDPTDPGPATS